MQIKLLGLAVVATLALSGAASAQSVTIETHDNMRGDRVMRSERIERMDRVQVRAPRVTGTVGRGKSAMAPGQLKKKRTIAVQTGPRAMELTGRQPLRGTSVTIERR